MPIYEVKIHYSTYASYTVNAENEDLAYEQALNVPVDTEQVIDNLDNWKDADDISEITKEEQEASEGVMRWLDNLEVST